MQPRKDLNNQVEIDENAAEEGELKTAKKAKIKKYIQMTAGVVGVGFMIYNVMFAPEPAPSESSDGATTEANSAPPPPPPVQDFAKDDIDLNITNKGAVAKKEVQEFTQAPIELDKANAPEVQAPDLPPLPEFKFTPPEKEEERSSKKNDEENINKLDTKTSKSAPDVTQSKPVDMAQNPDQIVAEKKNLNMFTFTNGQGGGYSPPPPKKSAHTGDKDFIIYDKTKLIEENKNPTQQNNNVSITSNQNLENFIAMGKIIDIVLETAINSQLPGTVRGIVSMDVFGESGVKILIPKGTRVYGSYNSTVARGQSRLNVIWNRVIRPDGVMVAMAGSATDQFGRLGIEGDVDNRYGEIFSNSLLLSFVNLGTAIALEKVTTSGGQTQVVNSNGSVATTNINPVNTAAQSVIQSTTDIVKQLTEGAMTLQPIVTLPQGTRMKIMVNQDITLPDYVKKKI